MLNLPHTCGHIVYFPGGNSDAPINIFPQRGGGGGGDTLGIRQQNNPNPRELDGTPRHGMGNYILFLELLN